MNPPTTPQAHFGLAESYLETAVLAVEQGFEAAAYQNALHALSIGVQGTILARGGKTARESAVSEFARLFRDRVPPLVLRQVTTFLEDNDQPLDPDWRALPSDELHHRVTRIGELVTEFLPGLLVAPEGA